MTAKKLTYNEALDLEVRQLLGNGIQSLGLNLSPAQFDSLLAYLELMVKWNKVYNLTAVRDKPGMVKQHLLDSLAIVPSIRGERVLDVGSGGGLPGIPLAIARPELSITLLDSNHKKSAFQQQAVIDLGLKNVKVICARVEAVEEPGFDTIVSRAFSDLAQFVGLTRNLLKSSGEWAAMKGVFPHEEIAQLPAGVKVAETIPLHVPGLEADRHLIRLIPESVA